MSKQDWLIFATVLLLGLVCWLAFSLWGGQNDASATIMQNGEIITTVTLDHYETLTIPGALGTSTIEIAPNQIRMLEASCPDHTCVKTGWIHHSGQVIACVPNRIVIRIQGNTPPVNAIAY